MSAMAKIDSKMKVNFSMIGFLFMLLKASRLYCSELSK